MRMLICSLLFAAFAGAANAVLLASVSDNTTAPVDDPGWARFGTRTGTNNSGVAQNGLTLIYIGNGWVLTANHVGISDLNLAGEVYSRVPGSGVQLQNPDGSAADLLAYRISGNPQLPTLGVVEFANTSPAIGTAVTMIGRGQNRGTATTWNQPPLRSGWFWGSGATMRWGTNQILETVGEEEFDTAALVMDFTKPGEPSFTADEAQAVTGDSGGGVWVKNGGSWELAGVLFSASQYDNQPPQTSLDGNRSIAADLALFRPQLVALVRPECSDEADNDNDGLTDYPADPGCSSLEDDSEAPPVPSASLHGTAALALLFLGGGFTWLRQHTSNTSA